MYILNKIKEFSEKEVISSHSYLRFYIYYGVCLLTLACLGLVFSMGIRIALLEKLIEYFPYLLQMIGSMGFMSFIIICWVDWLRIKTILKGQKKSKNFLLLFITVILSWSVPLFFFIKVMLLYKSNEKLEESEKYKKIIDVWLDPLSSIIVDLKNDFLSSSNEKNKI